MDDKLRVLAQIASLNMQEIQNLLGTNFNSNGKVQFPRGFVSDAATYKKLFPPFINEPVRGNLAYNRMFCDIVRWLAIRTDIYGIVLEMCIKYGIIALAAICEALIHLSVKIPKSGFMYKGKKYYKFKAHVYKLEANGFIDQKLTSNILEVWKLRNKIHIWDLDKNSQSEFGLYTKGTYNFTYEVTNQLILALKSLEYKIP